MVKILVIDDQPDNILVMSSIIKDLLPDATFISAMSGKEGLEKARKELPDVILLDIIMPEMDGYEVCRLLNKSQQTKYIPIIMITAIRTDSESRVKGLELGADAFLSKPVDETELIAQIKVMLRIKKSEDILRLQKRELQEIVQEKTSELNISKTRLKLILEGTDEGIWDWDIKTGSINFNDNWIRILGYEPGEIQFDLAWWKNNLDEQAESLFKRTLDDYIYGKQKFYELEYRMKDKFGEWKWIWARGIGTEYDEQGNMLKMQGTHRDITLNKQAEKQIQSSLKEKETMLQEIHHRVKNNMQVISSLFSLQASKTDNEEVKKILAESRNRVYVMATIHESLYLSDNIAEIDLESFFNKIVTTLFNTYSINANNVFFNIAAQNLTVNISIATPLGLILNELVSNSLKYAFPDNKTGNINIVFEKINTTEFNLIIEDSGVGLPKGFNWEDSKSLGLKLVTTLVEHQLEGSISMDFEKGTRFIIQFSL